MFELTQTEEPITEQIDTTTPSQPALAHTTPTKRVTRGSNKKKNKEVLPSSKAISKQTPLQYLYRLHEKSPKSIMKLCRLREQMKKPTNKAEEKAMMTYQVLADD